MHFHEVINSLYALCGLARFRLFHAAVNQPYTIRSGMLQQPFIPQMSRSFLGLSVSLPYLADQFDGSYPIAGLLRRTRDISGCRLRLLYGSVWLVRLVSRFGG